MAGFWEKIKSGAKEFGSAVANGAKSALKKTGKAIGKSIPSVIKHVAVAGIKTIMNPAKAGENVAVAADNIVNDVKTGVEAAKKTPLAQIVASGAKHTKQVVDKTIKNPENVFENYIDGAAGFSKDVVKQGKRVAKDAKGILADAAKKTPAGMAVEYGIKGVKKAKSEVEKLGKRLDAARKGEKAPENGNSSRTLPPRNKTGERG